MYFRNWVHACFRRQTPAILSSSSSVAPNPSHYTYYPQKQIYSASRGISLVPARQAVTCSYLLHTDRTLSSQSVCRSRASFSVYINILGEKNAHSEVQHRKVWDVRCRWLLSAARINRSGNISYSQQEKKTTCNCVILCSNILIYSV